MSLRAILVTGGAGFVGSHVARVARDAGFRVVALDDLSTTARWPRLPADVARVEGDVGDRDLVASLVTTHDVSAVIHLAGRIRVDESTRDPALYFDQNLGRTIAMVDAATSAATGVISIVLSSSAAVYGSPDHSPVAERAVARPINPYGASKLASEIALAAYADVRGARWAALRYFNVAGAHPDGSLAEDHEPETHLIPLAIEAALGFRAPLTVHGDDYPTRDGTCVRDYVHVVDLAEAHLAALEVLDRGLHVGAVNLGSGRGISVREILTEVAATLGRQVPFALSSRRSGDPPELIASIEMAVEKLGWRPRRGLAEIVCDAARSRLLRKLL